MTVDRSRIDALNRLRDCIRQRHPSIERADCKQIVVFDDDHDDFDASQYYQLLVEHGRRGPWWVIWDGMEYIWLDGPHGGNAVRGFERPDYAAAAADDVARVLRAGGLRSRFRWPGRA